MPVVRKNNGVFNEAAQEARGIAHEVLGWLNEIAEQVKKTWTESNTLYRGEVMNTAGDTAVESIIGPPPGVIWRVKRLAITSGANSGFAVYRNETQPQNLVEGEFNNAQIAAFDTDIIVYAGQRLVLRFFGQPVQQVCTVNLRIDETAVEE
jgi:hypothetical protein